jgi:hypothetical protein
LRFKIRPLHGLLIMLCLVAACGKSEKSGTPTSPAPHLATTATATQLNCSGIPKMPALPASARPKGKLQVKMVSNCQGHPNSCYSAKNGGVLYPVVQGNPRCTASPQEALSRSTPGTRTDLTTRISVMKHTWVATARFVAQRTIR